MTHVRLRANAVVLVFGEPFPGRKFAIRRAERNRGGQHETDRREIADRNLLEDSVARREGDGPDVPGGRRRPPDRPRIALEGARDRVEDEALAQSDPQVPGQNLRDVGDFARRAARAKNALAKAFATLARSFTFKIGAACPPMAPIS